MEAYAGMVVDLADRALVGAERTARNDYPSQFGKLIAKALKYKHTSQGVLGSTCTPRDVQMIPRAPHRVLNGRICNATLAMVVLVDGARHALARSVTASDAAALVDAALKRAASIMLYFYGVDPVPIGDETQENAVERLFSHRQVETMDLDITVKQDIVRDATENPNQWWAIPVILDRTNKLVGPFVPTPASIRMRQDVYKFAEEHGKKFMNGPASGRLGAFDTEPESRDDVKDVDVAIDKMQGENVFPRCFIRSVAALHRHAESYRNDFRTGQYDDGD